MCFMFFFFLILSITHSTAESPNLLGGVAPPVGFLTGLCAYAPVQDMLEHYRNRPVRRLSAKGLQILRLLEDAETCIPDLGFEDKEFEDRKRIFTSDLLRCLDGQETQDIYDASSEFARRHPTMANDVFDYLDPLVYPRPWKGGSIEPWQTHAGTISPGKYWCHSIFRTGLPARVTILSQKGAKSKMLEIKKFRGQIVNEYSHWKLPDRIRQWGG